MKLLLLLMVFIVAYFKFTWSLRQFNMLSLVVGAAPPPDEDQRSGRAALRAHQFALSGTSSTGHPPYFGPGGGVLVHPAVDVRGRHHADHRRAVPARLPFPRPTRRCRVRAAGPGRPVRPCSSFTATELMQ